MISNLPPWARHYVSYTPIVDFRIESTDGRGFSVLVRRQSGPTLVFIILSTALLTILPTLFFYHGFFPSHSNAPIVAGSRRASHSTGIPIFLLPLIVGIIGITIWNTLRSDKAAFTALRGKERWSFTHVSIGLPMDINGNELPDLLAGSGHIRATAEIISGKWVIDFSANNRNLYLGPFHSQAVANRCETELRKRLPHWFADAEGTARLSAVADGFNAGYSLRLAPIISFTLTTMDDGEFRLRLQRLKGPLPSTFTIVFLAVWYCFWLFSIVFIGWMILGAFIPGLPHAGRHRSGKDLEASLYFLPFWIALGSFNLWHFTMPFRRTETWSFTDRMIAAGRNSQISFVRRLPIDQTVQVRFGPFDDPPSVDFISQGKLLHLGPFATWDLAGEAMGDLEREFPHWHWPPPPEANAVAV